MLGHVFHDGIEVTVGVVYQTPSTTPSRHTVVLRQRANAYHGHLRVEVRERDVLAVGVERQAIVDFVTDQGDS